MCLEHGSRMFRFTLATELILVAKNGLEGRLERSNRSLCPSAQKGLYNLLCAVNTPSAFSAVEGTAASRCPCFPTCLLYHSSARALGRICTKNPYYLSC